MKFYMTNENTVKKFLPCLVQDTETLAEWLDALSEKGYLLRKYSMNFLFGEFLQSKNTERYFHLVIPSIKIQSRGIINDEVMDQSTISKYKESGMEYLGTTCGYLIFRTSDKKIIQKNVDTNGYLTKRNGIDLSIIQLICSIVSTVLLITNIQKLCINSIMTGLFVVLIIFLCIDLIYSIRNIFKKLKQIKKPDAILPLYMRDVKVVSSLPQIIFMITLLLIIILVIVILVISDSQHR